MSPLVEFLTQDGATIFVELPEEDAGVVPVGVDPSQTLRRASMTFNQALGQIGSIADAVSRTIQGLVDTPTEFELQLSVRLSADVGAIVAAAGAEATFGLTVKWQKSPTFKKSQAAE
jgi:hypothetical protein